MYGNTKKTLGFIYHHLWIRRNGGIITDPERLLMTINFQKRKDSEMISGLWLKIQSKIIYDA